MKLNRTERDTDTKESDESRDKAAQVKNLKNYTVYSVSVNKSVATLKTILRGKNGVIT